MAEVIQKVIDTTFNYTQLIGSSTFELYTAPAGTVMALKELNVTSKNIEGNVSLKIGNVSVGTSGTNDTLEGTQLIVAGEKLVLDTTAYKPGQIDNISLTNYNGSTISEVTARSDLTYAVTTRSVSGLTYNDNYINEFYTFKDGTDNYDISFQRNGNDITRIYVFKNGTLWWSKTDNGYVTMGYVNGKIYHTGGNGSATLYVVDIKTKTESTYMSLPGQVGSSYPLAKIINAKGKVYMLIATGGYGLSTGNETYVINLTDKASNNFNNSYGFSSNYNGDGANIGVTSSGNLIVTRQYSSTASFDSGNVTAGTFTFDTLSKQCSSPKGLTILNKGSFANDEVFGGYRIQNDNAYFWTYANKGSITNTYSLYKALYLESSNLIDLSTAVEFVSSRTTDSSFAKRGALSSVINSGADTSIELSVRGVGVLVS